MERIVLSVLVSVREKKFSRTFRSGCQTMLPGSLTDCMALQTAEIALDCIEH